MPVPRVPSSPLLSLTPELKQTIFSALPDARTLRSIVLTCSSFYHTFLGAESLIIKSILHTQIDCDLIHDAIIVFESTTLNRHDTDAAIDLLKLYAQQSYTSLSHNWKLRDALAIGGLQDTIEFFSQSFATSALSINPVTQIEDSTPSPLSKLEANRIKRTFYRYELFCNISRYHETSLIIKVNPEGPKSRFFSICAPWENEQLACVRDYLFDRLSIPFNDVSEHDVEWGSLEIGHLDDFDEGYNYWKEHYLSHGLAFLRQVVTASSFDDRCRLLKSCSRGPNCSLFDALLAQGYGNGLGQLDSYTEEEEHVHIPAQLSIDRDKGPEDAWRWAYWGYTNQYWYNINEQGFLRRRGYVMWDSARLARLGLLNHEMEDLPRESVNIEEQYQRGLEMRASFDARNRIWLRGGRGWWSAGDESRIIWLPPAPQEPKSCWGK